MYISQDEYFLKIAYTEAVKAFKNDDVPVGAIVVKDNQIISKGYNQRIQKNNAIYHAEILAIERACRRLKTWRLDDCTLYTTLEPCLMCTGAIIQSRIKKVVFGAQDEKGGAIISQYKIFDDKKLNHHPQYLYLKQDNCGLILKQFFYSKR